MAGLTLAIAETHLSNWLAASEAVAQNQSYMITTDSGSRTLNRANASEIQKMIEYWDMQCKRLDRGGIRVKGVTISYG
jgi:hypothetical protein